MSSLISLQTPGVLTHAEHPVRTLSHCLSAVSGPCRLHVVQKRSAFVVGSPNLGHFYLSLGVSGMSGKCLNLNYSIAMSDPFSFA